MSTGSSPSQDRPVPAVRWAGTEAFLLDCGSLPEVVRWHAHLAAHPFPGQVDVLAAATTVLVSFASARTARAGASAVGSVTPAESAGEQGRTVEIPVVYDGEDLAEVARLTGLGERGVVEAHTGALWTAAFGGFAPGFAYLVADGDPLDVPRRDSPRTAVPAGSVALAGTFSAVYPRSSPGGWQLIGRTNAVLWDEKREPPALIRPGDTVRYRAVRELVTVADDDAVAPARPSPAVHALVVEEPGMQTLVQDLGRPGLGDLGVPSSGAADRASAAQANRLVGNEASAAVLEVTLGGLSVTARGHHVLALAGAPVTGTITRSEEASPARPGPSTTAAGTAGPGTAADGGPATVEEAAQETASVAETEPTGHVRNVPFCAPFALYDGERLRLDSASRGLRCCVAVRGGLDLPEVLGSRSTDVLSGTGPDPVATGDVLPVRPAPEGRAVGEPEPPEVDVPARGETVTLRVAPGPRDDWFTPESLTTLTARTWRVATNSNRVGVRFEEPRDGPVLERARTEELASEGVVTGSLQVPHSGVPVLFLADHPVTGGYPVIGVVVPRDLALAAQLAPGTDVRFHVAGAGRTPRSQATPDQTTSTGESV
ncbi:MAG: carboxyltransferase domain-containing protein [Kocuria sp.]|uniref:5-oxoprolinase subunit B/C family protein n=1 Tax=Kocuria sp. TaxID=1871328 RepID=UPI0026DC23AE|nr:carboxyltransferase domain-containing protein [Kocuria sp.]MDO4257719.1 carboxyltransferase domain-containing protein [Kocuria sp.]